MLKVRDIMTRRVVSLAAQAPVESAIRQFASEEVSGAPVRDARGHLVGVVTKSDLVELVQLGHDDKGVVQDIMTPGVWAVHPDAPALDAVKLMLEQRIHRVLVIGGPDRLEGIVTSMDVMRALVGGINFSPPYRSFKRPDEGDEVESDDASEHDAPRQGAVAKGRAPNELILVERSL
jgi:CBS domain-containing protein